jgi:cystathionine beta-lyase/cystathionine gamma-synthase
MMKFATKALRVGQDLEGRFKPVIPPIYQSATFGWDNLDKLPPYDYTRCGNPNKGILEQVIAALENGKHCVCFSSGMAAIQAALGLLQAGDHFLMASDIYGGTHRMAHSLLPRQGISCTEFCAHEPLCLKDHVQENTKLVIFEGPTNPNLRVVDIAAIASEAKKLGLITVFDNTFASPYLQNPLDLGVDVVVHSTTKYISGHSDVVGGAIITNDETKHNFFFEFLKTVGSTPSPFDNWLSLRGVKTLAVRMRAHCENAQAVADYLDQHPKVKKVHYPGLLSHPDHKLAKRQMRGFGGMVAVEFNSVEDAKKVAESTRVFLLAESLGGVESLVAYPPLMSHATMSEAQRLERGIPPTMLRLSVGIEDPEDLIADLDQALQQL